MVSVHNTLSDPFELCYGVPQGSVIGPIIFILYTQPLTHVILNHPVSHTLYADDIQVYKSCNVNDLASPIRCIEKCVSDVKTWMLSNKLQMNENKTEVLLVTPKRVVNLNLFLSSLTSMALLLNSALTQEFGRYS